MQQGISGRVRTKSGSSWNRDQRALAWVRTHYPGWRSRFSEPFQAYLTRRPAWVPMACWSRWYEAPFRDSELNEHVRIVRRLLRENNAQVGIAPADQLQPWHPRSSEPLRGTFTGIESS